MGNTNINWIEMTDLAIIKQIGLFIKHRRLSKNKTQAQIAKQSGLNRWTISKIENGDSITLSSLIQLLRALDTLHVLNPFEIHEEISPLAYAKLKKKERKRARNKVESPTNNNDLEW